MKLDKFLLGILWIVSLLLAANFWFDMRFGFNMFARSHWRYLANIQTGPDAVNQLFYISLVVFALALPFGLYIITRPNRKIKLEGHRKIIPPTNQSQTIPIATPAYTAPQRPPQLTIPIHLQNNAHVRNTQVSYQEHPNAQKMENIPMHENTPPTPARQVPNNFSIAPKNSHNDMRTPSSDVIAAVNEIVSDAGYYLRPVPTIGSVRVNTWAVGTDEILLIGTVAKVDGTVTAAEGGDSKWKDSSGEFESPVWHLAGAVEKVRALFNETLDKSIKVDIKTFIVLDGGQIINADTVRPVWKAFGIDVFDSPEVLKEYMNQNKNRPIPEDEREDFEAYAEYIDTVAGYFNS
ncbi:MAG: hypothetical protein FWG80_03280 [Alphaproteobacteria bacterium]|nr:hypothetical protein [Alphaproteobacteria bacterium]